MIVHVYGKPFHLLAVGWGAPQHAADVLDFAAARLRDGSVDHDLTALAREAASSLGCLRGSYSLRPVPTKGAPPHIEERLAAAFARPASGLRRMTATDLARRLGLPLDIGTVRHVGAALRRQVGPPRKASGTIVWEVPNVWSDK